MPIVTPAAKDPDGHREYKMITGPMLEVQTTVHRLAMEGWVAYWCASQGGSHAVNMFRLRREEPDAG